MSELENDYEVEQEQDEIVEDVEAEEVEESQDDESDSSDLAPDSDEEHEEKPQDESKFNQDKVNQVINKKHREAMEAREEAERLRQQLSQYTQQQQQAAPDILPMPDPFDDDYESKVKQRDESIQQRARWESEQNAQRQYQQQLQQEQQRKQLEQLQAQAQTYSERAKSYGISGEELQAAANTVAQAGLSDDLAVAILSDEDGPLFTKYLASNPVEAYEIANMNTVQAALHLERVVRPKARALKPKTSNAPKPPTRTKQTVGDKELGKYQHIKGGSFE